MGKLLKDSTTTYIPGDPGSPGSPYVPPRPGGWVVVPVTTCSPPGVPAMRYVTVYPGQTLFGVLGIDADGFSGSVISIQEFDINGDGVADYTIYLIVESGEPVCSTVNQLVYVEPTAAVPAVPHSPPTPAQIVVSLNQGWNSYATSVDDLGVGSYIEFTVKPGTYGVLMAIGVPGMEGYPVSAFSHAVLVDSSGVYVFEDGAQVHQLGTNTADDPLRIHRMDDGRVAYTGAGGAYISSASLATSLDVKVYGLLYSAGDEVTTAEFVADDAIHTPRAWLRGSGAAFASPMPRARMTGAGELRVSTVTAVRIVGTGAVSGTAAIAAQQEVTLTGVGSLLADAEVGGDGYVMLLAVAALGSDAESTHVGIGYTELPLVFAYGAEPAFAPEAPTAGYLNLPFLTAWGAGTETDYGDGSCSLPLMLYQASEGEYGIGDVTLPITYASGQGGFLADDEVSLLSAAMLVSRHTPTIDLVLVIDSSGTLASTLAMTREQAMEFMSLLTQSDEFTLTGVYSMLSLSSGNLASAQSMAVDDLPDLDDTQVWVVNRDNNASSQYEQYGFNSFFERDGSYYGVANDGVYLLSGNDDAGNHINALVEMGRSNLGYTYEKRVRSVYLGVSSTEELYLKVDADEQTYVYRMRSSARPVRNRTVEVGWGVTGDYWNFTLLNPNGADFELASVSFYPIPLPRRG